MFNKNSTQDPFQPRVGLRRKCGVVARAGEVTGCLPWPRGPCNKRPGDKEESCGRQDRTAAKTKGHLWPRAHGHNRQGGAPSTDIDPAHSLTAWLHERLLEGRMTLVGIQF